MPFYNKEQLMHTRRNMHVGLITANSIHRCDETFRQKGLVQRAHQRLDGDRR